VLTLIILLTVVVMPVSAAYVAGFSGNPTSGSAPLTVQFTDLSSGAPSSWYWDFGDRATAETQNPSHTYTAPGTYSVRLTVTGGGFSDSNVQIGYISVDVPTPIPTITTPTATETTTSSIKAGFSGSPTTGTAPLTVTFTDSSIGSPTSWYWDFGDGSQSRQEKPPQHTYSVPGTYTVSLTVTGAGGTNVKTITDYVTVKDLATTVTTRTTAPVQTSATAPPISRPPTPVATPTAQNDQVGASFLYAIVIVVIVVIVEIAVIILHHRKKDKGNGRRE
jgi:PKD repeat protein